jgi:OmpA-OmpF porin, OOP family
MQKRSRVAPIVGRYRMALTAFGLLALSVPARAQQRVASLPPLVTYAEGEKGKISGVIVERDGDELKVREGDRAMRIVLLTDATKIQSPSGFLKLDRIRRDTSQLMPGLRLKVEGHGDASGRLVADEIKFSSTSLRTAEQINGGQEVLRNRVSANTDSIEAAKARARDSIAAVNSRVKAVNQRVTNLDDYDLKFETVVNFQTGSSVLSSQAKSEIDNLVSKSYALKGYVIEVTGYADTTGTEPYNRELSARRAEAVVAYLTEQNKVPLRRILNPTGHGSEKAVASNATPDGRAMNRRAQIRVLVNRAHGQD